MFSLRSYVPWSVPLLAGLLSIGSVPQGLPERAREEVRALSRDDFDGDGYQDLVITAPGATFHDPDGYALADRTGAGYVTVLYGGPHGPSTNRRVVISRLTQGVPGGPMDMEQLGAPTFKGDLDGDGYADLVLGGGVRENGAVVVWGGPRGLLTAGVTRVADNMPVMGDFDGDGRLDLVLVPAIRRAADAASPGGAGTIRYGPLSRSGTPARESDFADDFRRFDVWDGSVGDVNGDGRDELTLKGVCGPGATVQNTCVRLYSGSASGLGVPGYELPGAAAAVHGDLNGDGYDDVLSGATTDAGVGTIALGSPGGVRPRDTWTTLDRAVRGTPAAAMLAGRDIGALATGDITGDGIDDLAVGLIGTAHGEDGRSDASGAVLVLPGTRTGPTGIGAQLFTPGTPGMPGTADQGDGFGGSLRLLDLNGDGHADLTVGAPGAGDGDGRVYVLWGRAEGVVTEAAVMLDGKSVGAQYTGVQFGSAVR
ncbi:VCBS repeat-containing protein [Streptomyces sp. S.PB5]|uniref:FG-GAP repeat domain-containing protein n=1 Tax=Streptomyces sp. S.PB5 TaxID=3020844 RepID=UPI0025B10962|nr:VCBS repeat-containing protein [Streptomyces sp. S.PB5]MDN3024594.1 VCBS repeat-containing protein [Streptomyces sp. S.PB5]